MLVLAGLKIKQISEQVEGPQPNIKHLDVSGNFLKSGSELALFPNIESLIIDNNYFFSIEDFPVMNNLRTLSANKNNFNNLEIFVQLCAIKFPKLIHLSLIKNPFCPMFLGEEEYQKYRFDIVSNLKQLNNLDGTPVNPKEANPNYIEQMKLKKQQQQQQQQVNVMNIQGNEEAKGTIEYNAKYTKQQSKTVKSRSEGNRFVKNNQL